MKAPRENKNNTGITDSQQVLFFFFSSSSKDSKTMSIQKCKLNKTAFNNKRETKLSASIVLSIVQTPLVSVKKSQRDLNRLNSLFTNFNLAPQPYLQRCILLLIPKHCPDFSGQISLFGALRFNLP